jgi:type III secretion system FlhB-like substrate exporter
MYRIAEARGISGGEKSKSEPIYEDVDISLMNKSDTPAFAKMLVGYRVVKYSTVLEEDGTLRRSSPCSVEYNVYNRCAEAWMKEESYTDGYTKQGQYPPKYDTKFKRRAHFQSELKFAQAKAETKAYEKSIRELAGLMTGYKTADLKDGSFIFVKIRRSREVLQLETAARLQAMSQGFSKPEAAPALFGPAVETEPETIIGQPPEKEKTKREKMIEVLSKYKAEDLIPAEYKEKVEKIIEWLFENEKAEQSKKGWPEIIETLKILDENVPEFARDHGLY